MAITSSADSTYAKVVGTTRSAQALTVSKIKISKIRVTYGAGDNYTTGGNTVDLSDGGRIKTVIAAIPIYTSKGIHGVYVAGTSSSNGKFLIYGEINDDAAGVNTDAKELTQLTAASTITNSLIVDFLVIGY